MLLLFQLQGLIKCLIDHRSTPKSKGNADQCWSTPSRKTVWLRTDVSIGIASVDLQWSMFQVSFEIMISIQLTESCECSRLTGITTGRGVRTVGTCVDLYACSNKLNYWDSSRGWNVWSRCSSSVTLTTPKLDRTFDIQTSDIVSRTRHGCGKGGTGIWKYDPRPKSHT